MKDDEVRVIEDGPWRVTLGPFVEAAPNYHMPAWLELDGSVVDEPGIHARVELRDDIPRLVEVGWRAGPDSREIKPKDLRGHDLSLIIDMLYRRFVIWVDHENRKVWEADLDSALSRDIREFLDQRRTGKRQITTGFLKAVAQVYRDNIEHAPTEAVARTFGVKHRQATDYVKQARDSGFLPPTKQGRAKA
jgi:hypothetical protein